MCGIYYGLGSHFPTAGAEMYQRGSEMFGIFNGKKALKTLDFGEACLHAMKQGRIISHQRKASSGDCTITGCQPITRKGVSIFHNGTVDEMWAWATLNEVDIVSDTDAILRYILKSNKSASDVLDYLSKLFGSIGVVLLFDRDTGQCLLWSDGTRNIDIQYNAHNLNYIEKIQTLKKEEKFHKGYVLFDFSTGYINVKDIVEVKKMPQYLVK